MDRRIVPDLSIVDTLHGIAVPDPYRVLEDLESSATRAWIAEQSETFHSALDDDEVSKVVDRLKRLRRFTRFGVPERRGETYFVSRQSETGDAIVLALDALDAVAPDTVTLTAVLESSADGVGQLRSYSPTGRYLVFGVEKNRSRWQELVVYDFRDGRFLKEHLEGFYFERGSIAWNANDTGFYYTRYNAPPNGEEQQFAVESLGVFYHAIGTSQSTDLPIGIGTIDPSWVLMPSVTTQGGHVVVTDASGSLPGVFLISSTEDGARARQVLEDSPANYSYAGSSERGLFLLTDLDAPNSRVISLDLLSPERPPQVLIEESSSHLSAVSQIGDALVLKYVHAGATSVRVADTEGEFQYELGLPSAGWLWGLQPNPGETETFFMFGTLFDPGTIYRADVTDGRLEVVSRPDLPFEANEFEVRQVSYSSADGTQIPMYLAHLRGLSPNGRRPTWVNGYGAFAAVAAPFYRPEVVEWMRGGAVFAMPGTRGGGEYGAAWHAAGSGINKQNGIDDYIAAAEWLVEEGFTTPETLVAEGWSAGGVLAGAAIVQRPDLFRVALLSNPTLDQMRYHLFGSGAGWLSEYGSPDDPDEARALLAYSPYHNLHQGTCYPATLVVVGELDDTAVPSHGYKFVAAAQTAQGCKRPILLKVAEGAGHSLGATRDITVQTLAEQIVFVRSQLMDD
ncbi:MAG: prolyl oligopeptidase family serine peptidase [Gemmatimonadota bacterium]